jgi:ribosomal protein L23
MPNYSYSFQKYEKSRHVRAALRDKSISHKHSREIALALKGKSIEKENKLVFIVHSKSTKKQIIESMRIIYESDVSEVNTFNTIRGKKAIMKFKNTDGARQLATNLGLV